MASEREAAFATKGKDRVIEFNGKTHKFRSFLTEGTLLGIEQKLFDRQLSALKAVKDAMEPDEYRAELALLRKRKADGEFSFTNPNVLEQLQTDQGAMVLLQVLAPDSDFGDLLLLVNERQEEVEELLREVMDVSFADPKA